MREQTEVEGAKLMATIERKAYQILEVHGFSETGLFEGSPETYQGQRPASFKEELDFIVRILKEEQKREASLRDICLVAGHGICFKNIMSNLHTMDLSVIR